MNESSEESNATIDSSPSPTILSPDEVVHQRLTVSLIDQILSSMDLASSTSTRETFWWIKIDITKLNNKSIIDGDR